MKPIIRASVAFALAATLGMSTAFAQAPAAAPATPAAPAGAKIADDILDTAAKAGNFKTLAKALEAADLVKVLKGKGPFTVFAPTDEAFAKLPKEQTEALLDPKNKRWLTSALGAHVVAGKALKSERFVKAVGLYVKMNNGSVVAVDAKDPKAVKFGKGLVTKADIEASNGVIHVVDTVYLPKRVRTALFAIDKAAKAKAAAGPALEKAKDAGGKALEKAKEVGGKAVEATKDAAGKAVDKAKEVTGAKPATPAPANK
jgi:uncharacterized surface protein with fasciclin (FAS1) repeats